ncbi:peptidoglycan-associated lipoprotein Pal [Candidatus Sumerlaeota bacterium]|nr:peptidoglycan-associated lipoprotein Pal [Candidatus Sumerlaeota bacterium]
MLWRGKSLVRVTVALLLVAGLTTDCSWFQRMSSTPRRHWWEFWKPKAAPSELFYPKDMDKVPAPPTVGEVGLTAPSTLPGAEAGRTVQDVTRTLPETQPVRMPPRGSVSELQTVYFDYDRHDLRADAQATLDANVKYLAVNADVRILLEGHCDDRGTREYNLNLGARRANSVREYLVSKGISPDRLHTISYGEDRPIDPGNSEAAWAKNRRVEFKVY